MAIENNIGICKNCDYEGEPKKGYHNVCPKCLFNSLRITEHNDSDYEENFVTSFMGDGTIDIKGEISFKNKNAAIFFINGLIDQFDINREELDL